MLMHVWACFRMLLPSCYHPVFPPQLKILYETLAAKAATVAMIPMPPITDTVFSYIAYVRYHTKHSTQYDPSIVINFDLSLYHCKPSGYKRL